MILVGEPHNIYKKLLENISFKAVFITSLALYFVASILLTFIYYYSYSSEESIIRLFERGKDTSALYDKPMAVFFHIIKTNILYINVYPAVVIMSGLGGVLLNRLAPSKKMMMLFQVSLITIFSFKQMVKALDTVAIVYSCRAPGQNLIAANMSVSSYAIFEMVANQLMFAFAIYVVIKLMSYRITTGRPEFSLGAKCYAVMVLLLLVGAVIETVLISYY